MIEPPYYSTIVLFGKELERSVTSPNLFEEIVHSLLAFLDVAGCKLKCRGTIEGIGAKTSLLDRG